MLSFDATVQIDGSEPTVIVVRGNLCASTVLLLHGAVSAAMNNAATTRFFLDLRGVVEIDAMGMQALLELHQNVASSGRTLDVLGTSRSIERALTAFETNDALV